MIQLQNINKSFGDVRVLKNVSLTVNESEILAIVGPSGAGKTTLLQIAGTLDVPDTGSVVYDGVELTGLSDKKLSDFRNRNIGFVFQFHQLLPEFTALENVAIPAMIMGRSMRESKSRAKELLELLGLNDRLKHKPAQLSGGEKQRVAIARALVNDPKIVFADEPTGSLDTQNRNEIRVLISELRRSLGQAFVVVTHDESVAGIADRVVHLADGAVVNDVEEP
ncbi:MAG: ABC transporter ATP-binding protein [Prevotella sp.]|nr:ABC transporter ATP-binding protein [Bacteroides sp.]MCM1367182.1 ABC transporter ATP-binding protein [Prevotella sp.]